MTDRLETAVPTTMNQPAKAFEEVISGRPNQSAAPAGESASAELSTETAEHLEDSGAAGSPDVPDAPDAADERSDKAEQAGESDTATESGDPEISVEIVDPVEADEADEADEDRSELDTAPHSDVPGDGTEVVSEEAVDSASDPGSEEPTGDGRALVPSTTCDVYAEPERLDAALEAILFIIESPVSGEQLASVLQQPTAAVEAGLDRLAARYDSLASGIELRRIAGGARIYTRPELTSVVEAFLLEGQRTKLSNAALETLAVIAYRQPVSRGRISAIRGVNVDGVIRTLVTRGLIVEDGTDPESGAGLFSTTALFLEKMGLGTLEELPSLAPLLPEIDSLETDELSR